MLSLLLDTHILTWWRLDTGKLSAAQIRAIEAEERRGHGVAISAITLRELAVAVDRGRLSVGQPLDVWLEGIERSPLITVLPITSRIALESVRLGPDFPKDPADQIIVATALCHGLRLLTADERIRRWGKVLLV